VRSVRWTAFSRVRQGGLTSDPDDVTRLVDCLHGLDRVEILKI
jgi:hypothetical protein